MIVVVHADHPEPRKIRRAVDAVRSGKVIAYPTDTVYALGCDLHDRKAIEALHQMKGVDASHPLAFLCPDLAGIARYALVDNQAYRLLKRLCPGPYCFVLEATREVPKILQSRRKTVGVRVPRSPVAQAILRELGHPLLSTTAGRHGGDPCTDAREIDTTFPGVEVILDAGFGGITPSTVLDLSRGDIEVVREGAGPIDVL
jgi:tRNA threonylcarbamoyl adenosine modification protein (Sua5/YciO/YrdC/YwlC family)